MPSLTNLRGENFFNFVFNFSVDLDQRLWRLNSTQDGAWVGEFKLGDMEDGVHRFHSVGELEHEGMGTGLRYDCEGSEILIGELLEGHVDLKHLAFT